VFSSIEVIVRLWIWAQLGETQRCCRRDIALRIQSDTREYTRIRVGWRMKLIVAQWDSRKTPTTAVGWMPRRSATGMPKSPGCAGSRQAEPHADGAVAVGVLGTVLGFYRMGAGPSPDRSSKPAAPPTGSPTPETPAQQADSRWQSPHPWISTGTTTPPITGGWSTSPHATTGDVLDVDCGEQSRVEAFLRGQSRSGRTLIC
jgi:hypothetical protein